MLNECFNSETNFQLRDDDAYLYFIFKVCTTWGFWSWREICWARGMQILWPSPPSTSFPTFDWAETTSVLYHRAFPSHCWYEVTSLLRSLTSKTRGHGSILNGPTRLNLNSSPLQTLLCTEDFHQFQRQKAYCCSDSGIRSVFPGGLIKTACHYKRFRHF